MSWKTRTGRTPRITGCISLVAAIASWVLQLYATQQNASAHEPSNGERAVALRGRRLIY